ncbi:unnamed protein product [Ilex paraguariensis]|uniref:DYW domain-containing protein n=1 Tax=Ilex paraguariensis TaxID=185542 RepID=A0ABC8SWV5_9AQUA
MLQPTTRACIFLRTFSAGNSASASVASKSSDILEKVRALCTRGYLEDALSLFYALNAPHAQESKQTYATLFHTCANHNCLQQGQALHRHMLTHNPNNSLDLYVTNHLINMYAKCGYIDFACRLFDDMPHRNIVSWTAIISGYAQLGKADHCFTIFSNMLADCLPTEFAYTSVLSCCEREHGRQVHALAMKTSFYAYVYVANALITMYSKSCEYGIYNDNNNDDDIDEAWNVFKSMEFRNLISWNSMIAGFQIRGLSLQAVNIFTLMRCDDIGFDRATLLGVLSSLPRSNDNNGLSTFKCCFQLHCLCVKTGFISDIGVATALVKCYSNHGGKTADCYNIFLETSGRRDLVSWTVIMETYARWGSEKALFLFSQLRQEGLHPDCYTFSILLKACAGLVTEQHALVVHAQVMRTGFADDTVLSNALIHAYARCGSIALSKQVFNEMQFRDTVSWNSMLKAYALHGQANEALQLFAQMNVQPDATTFVALLSTCSHSGMVEEGWRIFNAMFENYRIIPQLDHFACMVDILGRAGKILQAQNLISKMPMEPDSVVWSALLAACRKHGETQLANLASARLKELDPKNSLGYVLMSNIYCSAGSFSEAGLKRKEMEGLGVRKEPGLSWTEVGSRVHEFASGGQRHPQGEAIRANLEELVGQLKGLGYVPQTGLALHDVEEEHKEEQLYYHSEKLALVFALMNQGSLYCSGNVIKIMKNIRICVDCHNFMKFASELIQREIVLRDSNRFHHFNGTVESGYRLRTTKEKQDMITMENTMSGDSMEDLALKQQLEFYMDRVLNC